MHLSSLYEDIEFPARCSICGEIIKDFNDASGYDVVVKNIPTHGRCALGREDKGRRGNELDAMRRAMQDRYK